MSPTSTPADATPAHRTSAFSTRRKIIAGLGIAVAIGAIAGGYYWYENAHYVYTDKAAIAAPLIQLAPQQGGILMSVLVHDGDQVHAQDTVARVGDETIQARVDGLVLKAQQDIGAAYKPGQSVVTMIEPKELRVVARIQEDKGLRDLYVGQRAIFTLDAFGSRQYEGTVVSISPTSRAGDVVFNISDQREEQEYEVKIQYDIEAHLEFLSGMSARVWIVK